MDDTQREKLRTAVADIRLSLEHDFRDQLEGTFGIPESGKYLPLENLTHLSSGQREQREAILAAISHYCPEQTTLPAAVMRYVREAAFTALNRLSALKLMEVENRRLIRPSLGAYRDSAGFKELRQVSPELCLSQPDEGYQFYIELLYDDLSQDLGVLFDRSLPQGVLFPSVAFLREILSILNGLSPEIWEDDETIGWIYQFFTPKQLRDQARKESSAPRDSYELALRNQFYTPRYVVEFLVDNTLGRLWCEMRRGDTALVERCRYMIHPPDQPIAQREKGDPRSLRILDPACGSAHFLLYGYDLLEVIYNEAYTDPDLGPTLHVEYPTLEEFQRAIPELILKNNLNGIDIDLRAAQIAALALWLRAQRTYQQLGLKVVNRPQIRRMNIVTAEPMPGEADLLNEFLGSLSNPVIRELVQKTWQAMQGADEIGSLLKIEQFLSQEVSTAKKEWGNLSQFVQLQLFKPTELQPRQLSLDLSFISDETFWENVEAQVLEQLHLYAAQTRNGRTHARKLFADDAEQGFAFVDLFQQPFDVVLMNPPFGTASKGAKSYIEDKYPQTKNDLYAAFVERGLELLRPGGYLGAITSRTGFFLTTFREWREEILQKKAQMLAIADLGYGVLDTAMVETAAYILRLYPSKQERAVFIRALLASDKDAKSSLILMAISNLQHDKDDEWTFRINPSEFGRLHGSPFAYWVDEQTIGKLSQKPRLEGNYGTIRVGLQTGDDYRFLRSTWEVPPDQIAPMPKQEIIRETEDQETESKEGIKSQEDFPNSVRQDCLYQLSKGKKWAFYSKTEKASPWLSPILLLVLWGNSGEEINRFVDEKGKLRSRPQNLSFYFQPGFSYMLRSSRLVPYIVPSGVIPTAGRAQVYPDSGREYSLLGYCASNIASAVARFSGESFARPKYQASMVQNLPVSEPSTFLLEQLTTKIEAEIKSRRSLLQRYEPYQEFTRPAVLYASPNISTAWNLYTLIGDELEVEISEIFGLTREELDELVRDIREAIDIRVPIVDFTSSEGDEPKDSEEEGDVEFIDQSPRAQFESLVSYAIGAAFGRWDIRIGMDESLAPCLPSAFAPLPICPPGMLVGMDGLPAKSNGIVSEDWHRARKNAITLPATDTVQHPIIPEDEYPLNIAWDGILVDDPGNPGDIVTRIREVFELLFASGTDQTEKQALKYLGYTEDTDFRNYLRKPNGGFWVDHLNRYSKNRRKAPIYWLLQSAKKNYALWLYYHRMDADTLFKALTLYADPKLNLEKIHLSDLHAQLSPALSARERRELEKYILKQEALISELTDFRNELERIARLRLPPDFDDGVIINIAPLHTLVPWKEAERVWDELLQGKYPWSKMSQHMRARGLVKD